MTPTPAADPLLSRAFGAVLVTGCVLSVSGGIFLGWRAGLGVLVGATIALVNLWVLSRAVQNLLGGTQLRWVAIALLKFLALLGLSYGLVQSGSVQPLCLAAGFAALPLGIFIAGTLFVPADSSSASETDHA